MSIKDARQDEENTTPKSTTQEFSYDWQGRLTGVTYKDVSGNAKEGYMLTYDNADRIVSEDMTQNYSGTVTTNRDYEYDWLGRLTKETVNNVDTTYTYDEVGNRTSMTEGSDTYNYTYNDYDQLTEIKKNDATDTTYVYDLSGNQISRTQGTDSTTVYTYSTANQLTQVAEGSTTVATYTYDAESQRTSKTVGSDVTNYLYDNEQNLLYTTDGSGNILEKNILEPDGSVIYETRTDAENTEDKYWYRQDIRGSITNIVDETENVVKSYTYDAYGNTSISGTFLNSFAYTGAVSDPETGLYYMNARYYDPQTGRFISQDSYRVRVNLSGSCMLTVMVILLIVPIRRGIRICLI